VGAWRGEERAAGLAGASEHDGDLTVAALAVVNAFGDLRGAPPGDPAIGGRGESTTLVVVATNGRLTKRECLLVAQSAHDGLARALEPAHTQFDGDAAIAAATNQVDTEVEAVRLLAARATERAIREAAR
jgi:L-aminopeptidase/D-esterase-like protein